MIIPIGTVSRNNHWHLVAWAIASAETAWTVSTALAAVDAAIERLFSCEGDAECHYFMSDSGPVATGVHSC
jgi:hypothetical protein